MAFYQEIGYACIVPNSSLLGDGICHNFDEYNTAGCRFDRGDCEEFNKKFPDCKAKYDVFLGDGKCDGPLYNTLECEFDGGDCLEFNKQYPNCDVANPILVGKGKCDEGEYNTMECGWDGQDCLEFSARYPNCTAPVPSKLGDGRCHGGVYNTLECGWDNGDCDDFNKRYPNCSTNFPFVVGDGYCDNQLNTEECGFDGGDCSFLNKNYPNCTHKFAGSIGNNKCHSDPDFYSGLHTEECGYDGGDCDELIALYPDCPHSLLGNLDNGRCDGVSNIEECGWDNGACIDFNLNYPNCKVDMLYRIGDDVCDVGEYYTEECGWDGGDCVEFFTKYPNCTYADPYYIGDGWCDNYYNTTECGFDGDDCIPLKTRHPNCIVPAAGEEKKIGNNICNGGIFNNAECGWEGGDCVDFNEKYPDCHVSNPSIVGDGICHSGKYNTLECGWDGGDCETFNKNYPGCHTNNKNYLAIESFLGDGKCHGGELYSEECDWEGGDCDDHFTTYPNCSVTENMYKIGNGNCDYGAFNTPECDYDGGDCAGFNEMYPLGCFGVDLLELGDGICQHNTEGCNYDDGDCDRFRALYPDCTATKPYLIGDGYCNEEYNTVECKKDGGDCETTSFLLVNGVTLSVDDYRRDTMIYAIIQTCSSLVSLVSSIGILWILRRSLEGFSVPFHRLLCGLCIADICSSSAQSFSTLPAPDRYYDVIWNAQGNKASCRVQGFFIFLGSVAAPMYNCSLCIYYLIIVTYKKGKNANTYVKGRIEYMLHAVPIVFSLVGAVTILSLDAFHPNMTYCFIGPDPSCDDPLDCKRTDMNANILFVVFSAGPYIVLPCVIIGTMTMMYRAVRWQEKRLNKFGASVLEIRKKAGPVLMRQEDEEEGGTEGVVVDSKSSMITISFKKALLFVKTIWKNRILCTRRPTTRSNSTTKQRRAVLNRAFAYSLAFFCTYLFPIMISIRTLQGKGSNQAISILARLLFPLQGFFNFVVFIYPKVLRMKKSSGRGGRGGGEITWYRAFVMASTQSSTA